MVFCFNELRKINKLIKRKYFYVFFILIKKGINIENDKNGK